jgi:sterol desaturase/sphingolipid hydroxylase (fatty acid hydroxylase superfamily)
MREFFLTASAWEIIVAGWLFFGGIYLVFGALNWLLTHQLLPYLKLGRALDPRPLAAGQLRRELSLSAVSIFIFGAGMVFPWGLLQLGWAELALNPSLPRILLEITALVIWNEVHFYLNHRLLHTPWLRRFHLPHHRSVVTTPWSTYSFHPIEALMLGNVILLPMLVHGFSAPALLSVPIFSLVFNNIGHANYDFSPKAKSVVHNASRRHHLHHACFNGNFGFMLPFMDQLLRTALPSDAASVQLARWQERNH